MRFVQHIVDRRPAHEQQERERRDHRERLEERLPARRCRAHEGTHAHMLAALERDHRAHHREP